MTITVEDLQVSDKDIALRVIAHARAIAPCLTNLQGNDRETAIAILRSVAQEAQKRGNRWVSSQRVGSASASYYGAASSWFTDDDKNALRALCLSSAPSAGHPIGHFPQAQRTLKRVWPEEEQIP